MSVNADKLVQIVPRIIEGGTTGLSFSGLLLTKNNLPPAGRVLRFASAQAVGAYFGTDSLEYDLAQTYFSGYSNTTNLPEHLFFAPFNENAVSAWLRSAKNEKKLAQIKELGIGGMTLVVDGTTYKLENINLSYATSFSDVANILDAALRPLPTEAATHAVLTGGKVQLQQLEQVQVKDFAIIVNGERQELHALNFNVAPLSVQGIADYLDTNLSGVTVKPNEESTGLDITTEATGEAATLSFGMPVSVPTPATPATLTGGSLASAASAISKIDNGTLKITVGGQAYSVRGVDMTGGKTNDDLAAQLQEQINGGIVSFDHGLQKLIIACTEAPGTISYAETLGDLQPATAGKLTSGVVDIEPLKTISDGSFKIAIDGKMQTVTGWNLQSSAESLDIDTLATQLGQKLTGCSVTVAGQTLVITSSTTGLNSVVAFATPAGEGTDLSSLLRLSSASGAASQRGDAAETDISATLMLTDSTATGITPGTPAGIDITGFLGLTAVSGATEVNGKDAVYPPYPSVTYSSQTEAWQITSATTGPESTIEYAAAPESGTDLATALGFTQQAGAVISDGMAAQSLTDCMTNVLNYARDWVTFGTVFDAGLEGKIELAKWCSSWDTRFCFVNWEDANAAKNMGDTSTSGTQIANVLQYDGTCSVFNTPQLMAFVMGTTACINFNELNGRLTYAFRQGEGLAVTCDRDEDYDSLTENGYNVYADFATAASNFNFFQPGQVSGKWAWMDTYINAIALKDGLQLNLLDLFKAAKSVPYNDEGYGMVRTACLDTISRFLNFGAIRVGVKLSNTQKVQLKAEIGEDVSQTLESIGWYMQVKDPGSVVRAARGTPDCKFYYMDGGSIQKIVLPATAIQ